MSGVRNARTDDQVPALLKRLDDDIFYGILDVALDIEGELTVSNTQPVRIQGTRTVLRHLVLCPGLTVGAMYRYVELRGKGLQFLQKYGFIDTFTFRKTGFSGFDGFFYVTVTEKFEEVLLPLRLEEDRRDPDQKMDTDIQSATARIVQLADAFHRAVLQLRKRRSGREPLLINDEYDVQYIFAAFLETRFADVRLEEWGPSYAGRPSRLDFLLKEESVLVETKMIRSGLGDRKLGDELILDIAHYKERSNCKAIVCFVYDPEHQLTNPRGIENDLSKTTDGINVRVLVRPAS
jgi:hypothetical protein